VKRYEKKKFAREKLRKEKKTKIRIRNNNNTGGVEKH